MVGAESANMSAADTSSMDFWMQTSQAVPLDGISFAFLPDRATVSVTVKRTSHQENGKRFNIHFRIFIAIFFAQRASWALFVIFLIQ